MIPRVIHQFWHAPDLPPGIADYVARWRKHHPGWQHILWNDGSATDYIRSQFGSEAVRCFLACTIPAMRSDVLRLAALLIQGGVYADADGRSFLPMLPLLPVEPQTMTLLKGTKEGQLLNGFIAAAPADPFIQRLWERALFNIRQPDTDSVSFASGPGLFRTVWRDLTPEEQSRVRIVSWLEMRPYVKFKLHTNELPAEEHWSVRSLEGPIVDFGRVDTLLQAQQPPE